MYIAYQGADRAYAYVKESKRVNGKVESKGTYLGKAANKDLGVFYTPERGFFTYDVDTGQYGNPPDAFVYPVEQEHVYCGQMVPPFQSHGYRHSGAMVPPFRRR